MSDSNGQGDSRLDRMEKLMELLIADHVKFADEHEKFLDEHKRLLIAQVVLTDRVEKLGVRLDQLAIRVDQLAIAVGDLMEAQKHTDVRLNALINVVDDLVRKRPPLAS
jgi:hypothetical protein